MNLIYPIMKYYTAEKNEQSTAIHNADKYQIIMLNEKNVLHKNTYGIISFTKNEAICSGGTYVC